IPLVALVHSSYLLLTSSFRLCCLSEVCPHALSQKRMRRTAQELMRAQRCTAFAAEHDVRERGLRAVRVRAERGQDLRPPPYSGRLECYYTYVCRPIHLESARPRTCVLRLARARMLS